MKTETGARSPAGEGENPSAGRADGEGRSLPPAEFIYDNGHILLELLRGRAEEEDRRRFLALLRSLRVASPP